MSPKISSKWFNPFIEKLIEPFQRVESFVDSLIFFNNISSTSIDIYKQRVNDPNEAQNIPIPADDDNKNYGWNTYKKL